MLLTACTGQPAHPAAAIRPTPSSSPRPSGSASDVLDSLLPIPPGQLRAATTVAVHFAAAQATYRFDEPPQSYLARLRPFVSRDLYSGLARDAFTPGTRAQRTRDHVIATGQATPVRMHAIMPTSVILIVSVHQTITTTSTRQRSDQIAITLTTDGTTWSITSIQPAGLGDAGDTTNDDEQ